MGGVERLVWLISWAERWVDREVGGAERWVGWMGRQKDFVWVGGRMLDG